MSVDKRLPLRYRTRISYVELVQASYLQPLPIPLPNSVIYSEVSSLCNSKIIYYIHDISFFNAITYFIILKFRTRKENKNVNYV